jgi:TetR/AcrR family transcriptional regulator, transcriptional repressor for nem operon
MPYPAEHKAQTRARIIESARVMFNRRGFDQVSIDDIMKEAGLTRGGFYYHFESKQELYAEAVRSFSTCNPFAREVARTKLKEPRTLARRLVELYLSDDVLDDVDRHCPLIAVPSDVARAGLKPREAYTQVVQNMLHVFRSAFAEADRDAGRKAMVMVNLCVGGMVIARTTDDPQLRKGLRVAARAQALAMLGEG